MEQFIEAPKKRGRPTKTEELPKIYETIVSYDCLYGETWKFRKTTTLRTLGYPENIHLDITEQEQEIADRKTEKMVHINVPSFLLKDEFEKKRPKVRIIIMNIFKMNWATVFLLLLTSFTVHAETEDPLQFCKKFVDNDGCTAIISYHQHDEVASIYWPELKKAESIKIPLKYVTLNHINYGAYNFYSRNITTYTAGSNDKQNSSHKAARKSSQD